MRPAKRQAYLGPGVPFDPGSEKYGLPVHATSAFEGVRSGRGAAVRNGLRGESYLF